MNKQTFIFFNWLWVWMIVCAIGLASPALGATALQVSKIEVTSSGQSEEVRFFLSQPVEYKTFFLDNPDRLVIDIPHAEWRTEQALPGKYKGKWLKKLRVGRFNPTTNRIVLELAQPLALQNSRIETKKNGAELLLVLQPKTGAKPLQDANPVPADVRNSRDKENWAELAEKTTQTQPLPPGMAGFTKIPVPVFKPSSRTVKPVIVIDAGHGGQDPGATGASGAFEKNITLSYARALNNALLRTGKYHVVLTRDDDRFIMLRDRMGIGRQAKGDVFISIHADTAENPQTRGFSIYTLSNTASDAEAAALATRENKVDLVYGLNLSNEHQDVTEILIDLAQRETMKKSSRLAEILVNNLSRGIMPLPNTHRYAGFAVLKAPDVPSVLIELGFLSHKDDEKLLKSDAYRQKVVNSLVNGLDAYFAARQRE